jgi:branched-subunit amino acid transport protein
MSLEFILLVAAITYGSRAIGLAALPDLPPRVAATLERMPSALFAGLAMQALVLPGPTLAGTGVLAAVACALLVAPRRSLPACLLAGTAAYAAAALLG